MKLLKGIILFTIIATLVIFLLEKKYANYQTTYDIILKKLIENKNECTDIYIGNSHTMALKKYSNIPEVKIINIGTAGQDIFKTYNILKKWIPLMPKLQHIYFGLDYETMGQNLSLSGLDYEDRQLYPYTDTLYKYSLENIVLAKSNFFRANRDVKFLYSKQILEDAESYIPPAIKLSAEDCKKRALEHSMIRFKKELINENAQLLSALLRLAKQYNKSFIIYNPPKTSCYKQNEAKENIALAKATIDSVFKANNTPYYNFYDSEEYTNDYFLDYDHLNEKGRIKFVQALNKLAYKN